MKAVTLGDDGVEIKELPNPEPNNEQVLVKVKSCGLNRSDLLETQGQSFGHTGGDTKIIGGEFAGEIVELGDGVEDLKVGDKVMCRGGSGWAEYAVANHKKAIKFNTELFHLDIREKLSARIVKGLVSGKKLITLELRTEI